jgi:hypothetical protein
LARKREPEVLGSVLAALDFHQQALGPRILHAVDEFCALMHVRTVLGP